MTLMCQASGSRDDTYEYSGFLIRNVGQSIKIIPTFPLILDATIT